MTNICVSCENGNEFILDFASGDYICAKCGCVQPEHVIDEEKEWPEYDEEKGESNIRAERVDEFGTLGTAVPTGLPDIEEGSGSTRYSKIMTKEDRVANQVKFSYARVNELSETLQIPSIVKQTSKAIIKQFFEKGSNLKGLKKDAFIVAVILIASKKEQGARSLKGLARQTNIAESDIKRFYKVLIRDSDLNTKRDENSMSHQVVDMVEQFCNRLRISFGLIKEATLVAESSIHFLEGKRPSSIAAAAILFMINLKGLHKDHKQADLATVAGISTNTLRNVYKELTNNIEQIPAQVFTSGKVG